MKSLEGEEREWLAHPPLPGAPPASFECQLQMGFLLQSAGIQAVTLKHMGGKFSWMTFLIHPRSLGSQPGSAEFLLRGRPACVSQTVLQFLLGLPMECSHCGRRAVKVFSLCLIVGEDCSGSTFSLNAQIFILPCTLEREHGIF